MMVRVYGLVKRGGVYIYRREVPSRQWKVSLDTSDLLVAQRRVVSVAADVERAIREAEAGQKNSAVLAYRIGQEWKTQQAQSPTDPDTEDAINSHITDRLEEGTLHGKPLDGTTRATLEAFLKRRGTASEDDNPPLTILFDRYDAERKLPPKTKLEWNGSGSLS